MAKQSPTKINRKTTTAPTKRKRKPKPKAKLKGGRPPALDNIKRAEVLAVLSAGLSVRKAAEFVGCDPRTIRREAQRSKKFRTTLTKAKSEAAVSPYVTLRDAGKTNWRAALAWLDRLDKQKSGPLVTKQELNRYIRNLAEAIERIVTEPQQRAYLFEILDAAMPASMRNCWEGVQPRRDLLRIIREHGEATRAAIDKQHMDKLKVAWDIGNKLPHELKHWLWDNPDVIQLRKSAESEVDDSAREKVLEQACEHGLELDAESSDDSESVDDNDTLDEDDSDEDDSDDDSDEDDSDDDSDEDTTE